MTRGALAETGLCRRPDGEQPLPERLSPSLGMKNKKQLKTRGRKKKKKNLSFFPVSYPSPSLPISGLYMFNELASCLSVFLSPLLHAIPSPPVPTPALPPRVSFSSPSNVLPAGAHNASRKGRGKKKRKRTKSLCFFGFFFF